MIKVTVDIFSGRPNPAWIIDDERGKDILKQIAKNREVISKIKAGYNGLGFRGIHIELMGDEKIKGIPSKFAIANGTVEDQTASLIIARDIVDQMLLYEKLSLDLLNLTPLNKNIQKIIFESINAYEKNFASIFKYTKNFKYTPTPIGPTRVTLSDHICMTSQYEESRFNPNFWNSDLNVMNSNNCYNYARNWRTDTFAQPGRYAGQQATGYTCPQVKAAALRDGLVERCTSLLPREYPRRLMALVVAPGIDYHWYRKHTNGFWGHKPGSTPARNTDNNGFFITDPETCDRGAGMFLNYSDFCGYFYAGRSVRII